MATVPFVLRKSSRNSSKFVKLTTKIAIFAGKSQLFFIIFEIAKNVDDFLLRGLAVQKHNITIVDLVKSYTSFQR